MLYDLLKNRPAINLLKYMSTEPDKLLLEGYSKESLDILEMNGLIRRDDRHLLLSLKGKNFILMIDELKTLIDSKKRELKLEVSLTDEELQILKKFSKGEKVKKSKKLLFLEKLLLVKNEKITSFGKRTLANELLRKYNLL